MASSSLVLPSLAPKSLVLSKPTTKSSPSSLFFNSVSLKSTTTNNNNKSFSISSGFNKSSVASRFVRNVSLTSEFDQEEEVGSRGGGGRADANFAQELKLFVGNLSFNVDSAQLAGLFERAGNVEMVEVIYDKMTGRSRGFAFVTMSTVEEVKAAAQQFDGYELDGRAIRVNYGPPPPKGEFSPRGSQGGGGGGGGGGGSSTRCYVGNLSWGVDDEALENLFSEQGKVLEARVVYDRESGRSRGFGFVTYGSPEEVDNAISSLNGVDLNGREIRVSAAEERQRRF